MSRTGIASEGQDITIETNDNYHAIPIAFKLIIRVCSHQGYTHSTPTVTPCYTVSAQGDCLPLGFLNIASRLWKQDASATRIK